MADMIGKIFQSTVREGWSRAAMTVREPPSKMNFLSWREAARRAARGFTSVGVLGGANSNTT
jgi:hypothetical protein